MAFLPSFDEKTTQLKIFERWPEISLPLGELTQQLLREGPFSKDQAELIFSFISGVNACEYCHNIHRLTAEIFGIDKGLLESLLDDIDTANVDEKLKPILRYVRKLTETPYKIVQTDVDAILEAGWSETEFHYATSICAIANYYNRIIDGHGIQLNEEYLEQSAKRLSTLSYIQVLQTKQEE